MIFVLGEGGGSERSQELLFNTKKIIALLYSRAVGRGGAMGVSTSAYLRGRVKMTLRMQEKWTSTT